PPSSVASRDALTRSSFHQSRFSAHPGTIASHDRRSNDSDRDKHLDLRVCDLAALLLRSEEGLSIVTSFRYSLIMSLGAPLGSAIGAFAADSWRRKPTIVGASLLTIVLGGIYPFLHPPTPLMTVGSSLTVPIYILVPTLFPIYIP